MHFLIIDKDVTLFKTLQEKFSNKDWHMEYVNNLDAANASLDTKNFDLIVLDWQVHTIAPVELIEKIRMQGSKASIIVTNEKYSKQVAIDSLKSGADDFIAKPFHYGTLEARFEARLRFGGTSVIEIDDLIIDPDEEKILYKNVEIELKGKPFEVLTHLAKHREVVVSKEQLLDAIWEEPELVTPNVIEVAINQIRQKMDKPLAISTIETVRRKGYRFCYPRQAQEL